MPLKKKKACLDRQTSAPAPEFLGCSLICRLQVCLAATKTCPHKHLSSSLETQTDTQTYKAHFFSHPFPLSSPTSSPFILSFPFPLFLCAHVCVSVYVCMHAQMHVCIHVHVEARGQSWMFLTTTFSCLTIGCPHPETCLLG